MYINKFIVVWFITMHGSRNFRQGESRLSGQKKPLTTFFFYYFLFDISPQLIFSYTEFF